ncbi:MAG: hypothetical protein RIS64_1305 [Bacteroidota bacterium]|jgi:hypothetical protein
MMTIQEIRQKLYFKEILSQNDLIRLCGGTGEDDKRKELSALSVAIAAIPPPPDLVFVPILL